MGERIQTFKFSTQDFYSLFFLLLCLIQLLFILPFNKLFSCGTELEVTAEFQQILEKWKISFLNSIGKILIFFLMSQNDICIYISSWSEIYVCTCLLLCTCIIKFPRDLTILEAYYFVEIYLHLAENTAIGGVSSIMEVQNQQN